MVKVDETSDSTGASQQPGRVFSPGQPEQPASTKPLAEQVDPAPRATRQPDPASAPTDGDINWSASEFVAHEKSTGWYGALVLVAGIVAALVYAITGDVISTVVVILAALAFATLARRKPRELQYKVNDTGITIGQKHHSYSAFKSFSVVPEGAFSSIVFTPLKRFAPLTTIYYAPEDEDKILDLLSDHLPFEEHKLDAVDNMMRRIRF